MCVCVCFNLLIFNWRWLLCHFMLVSALHQHESTIEGGDIQIPSVFIINSKDLITSNGILGFHHPVEAWKTEGTFFITALWLLLPLPLWPLLSPSEASVLLFSFFFPPSPFFPVTAYSLVDIWENLKSQFTLIFKECASLSLKKKAEETNIYLVLTVYQGLCTMLWCVISFDSDSIWTDSYYWQQASFTTIETEV